MFRLPFFGRQKLLLAFEYGLLIAETARQNNVEINPELIKKAEIMLEGEARSQTATHMATQIVPNLLSVFELDTTK